MDTVDSVGWRTSSYTGTNGNCVEVGGMAGIVLTRDTKDRDGVARSFRSSSRRRPDAGGR